MAAIPLFRAVASTSQVKVSGFVGWIPRKGRCQRAITAQQVFAALTSLQQGPPSNDGRELVQQRSIVGEFHSPKTHVFGRANSTA